ncbi:WecB/TagA/CpsF family glycosyltransferase [Blastococcus mobilis]|uniref:WecB/TagA/CpsF family glycosyltransferase n=1 Tax=Blastococcus mobilis TaxID=1938746 RepID=UPI0034A0B552
MESLRSPRALNLVDGTSLRIAMLLEGKRGVPVSRGPSLFRLALEEGAAHGKKQILLGGSSDFDSQMRATLSERNVPTHNLRVIDPGYQRITPAWLEAILTTVRQYGDSDVIWVGLGTPKQDIVADYITKHLGVTTVAVGAAFDFYAGSVREAPQWLHHSGFEWVYRLLKEPRRLWRRYALGNLAFARLILRSHLRARLVRRKP